jgi:alpha-tubulin suppressor-like RCC1 family protein
MRSRKASYGSTIHWSTWRGSRGLVAVLTPALVATFACGEAVESPTAPASAPTLAPAATATLMVRQVNAGNLHNCAVATDNRAYCWGWNVFGQIGDGTTSYERPTPTLVRGGLSFRQISAGTYHTCGVTTANRAYCWGLGGHVGDGTNMSRLRPAPVAGGLSFRQVSAGQEHTCGVTTDDRVYCWGDNVFGQLGNGTTGDIGYPELSPVAVMGTLRFRGVSVGTYHSCGVTTTDRAYCWGGDQWGQVGDGAASGTCQVTFNTLPCRKKPTLVAGGYRWRQVDAGGGNGPGEDQTGPTSAGRTCGVTTDGRAFCWGDGTQGQNGDGTRSIRTAPSKVAGDRLYRAVSTGHFHSCAVATNNRAYCWGVNHAGQVGDGTEGTMRLRPRAVVGGLLFDQVSAGDASTCGRTATGAAYCWGFNVGNGLDSHYLTPQPVGGAS